MKRIYFLLVILTAVGLLLAGCSPEGAFRIPQLPAPIQKALDAEGISLVAPTSGDNRQSVHLIDLDGDGLQEYVIYGQKRSATPLQVLVFSSAQDGYRHRCTIACSGERIEQVEYASLDNIPGLELVLTRAVSPQVNVLVSVYSVASGGRELASAGCVGHGLHELDGDEPVELVVFSRDPRSGGTCAAVYNFDTGTGQKTDPVLLAVSPGETRIIPGKLADGSSALYIPGKTADGLHTAQILTLHGDTLEKMSVSLDGALPPWDINGDGVLEIAAGAIQSGISWGIYPWDAVFPDASRSEKHFCFHDLDEGWYLELSPEWADRITVEEMEDAYAFYLVEEGSLSREMIFTVYAFRGEDREEQSIADNRFVLCRTDSTIYAARLEVASGAIELSQEMLKSSFGWISHFPSDGAD